MQGILGVTVMSDELSSIKRSQATETGLREELKSQDAEIAKLRADNAALIGDFERRRVLLDERNAEIAKLRTALQPFVGYAKELPARLDPHLVEVSGYKGRLLRVRHFLAAREALGK